MRGCTEKTAPRKIKEIDIEIDQCPYKLITAKSKAYIELYSIFAAGVQIFDAAWLKHPMKPYEAFSIIVRTKEKLEGNKK